jgi:hypothetical protein
MVSRLGENGFAPSVLTIPQVGFKAQVPQKLAGRMIDPPVWVPIATGTCPSATAAAEPLDDPPGV